MPWPTSASNAVHPHGTGLFYNTLGASLPSPAPAVGTSLSTLGWSEIGIMTRVTSPERAAGDTKITHLKSPDKAHEYVPGYVEPGNNTFRILHSPAAFLVLFNLAPKAETTEQRKQFCLQLSNGDLIYFAGYVKSLPVEVTEGDDPIAIDVTIKVSGDIKRSSPA